MKDGVYAGCMSHDRESDSSVRKRLRNSASEIAGDPEQRRLHEAAEESIGVLSSSDAARSENARRDIGERLRKLRER